MSIKVSSIVWESDLPRASKYILLCYADFADDDGGSIFPAINRISWKTSYSRRQVIRVTKQLIEAGVMSEVGKTEHGTIVYRINLGELPPLPPYMGGDISAAEKSDGGDILTRGG